MTVAAVLAGAASWHIETCDVLEGLHALPDDSIHMVCTSPPYYGLRDYGVAGAIGLEPTVDEYVTRLVEVFAEVRRVLRPDGTLWLNLGDSYSSAEKGANGDARSTLSPSGVRAQRTHRSADYRTTGLARKQLIGIPWRVAFALQADDWFLRSDIIWAKTNAMPESVTDRPTRAHEYLFLLAKAARYFYDAGAVRQPPASETKPLSFVTLDFSRRDTYRSDKQRGHGRRHAGFNKRWDQLSRSEQMARGANLRTVWAIAPAAFPGGHFATFPPALVVPCVLAGSRPDDLVLDPFAGAGTTLMVARRLGRRALGVEVNPDYANLARRRIEDDAPLFHRT